jgi:hypothetical protein
MFRWLFLCLVACVGLSGCCSNPWSVTGAPDVPPDIEYREPDGTHGNDVYVWKCLQGRRVVVSQYTAEMSCREPRREEFACDALSPLEVATPEDKRVPVPESRRWPR